VEDDADFDMKDNRIAWRAVAMIVSALLAIVYRNRVGTSCRTPDLKLIVILCLRLKRSLTGKLAPVSIIGDLPNETKKCHQMSSRVCSHHR
jgi:hypothetical protein